MIRSASSVLLRRDSEIYLARRSPALRFFGGFWACAGGKVSEADLVDTPRSLPFGDDLRTFAIAAARELFEELGVELSENRLEDPEAARRQLLLGATLTSVVGAARMADLSRLRPVLRLLTPDYHPIRFDTQFFLLDWCDLAAGTEPAITSEELDDGRWDEPTRWLQRWRAGDVLIAPPVLLILQCLAQHGMSEGLARLAELERTFGGEQQTIHTIFCAPAVQLMPVRTPTLPPAQHTNAYLVGQNPAYLVDPATPYPDEQDRLERTIDQARFAGLVPERRIGAILLTHHHPDHIGAVERLRSRFAIPVWAHAETRELLAGSIEIDRVIEDGEDLPLGTSPDGRPDWSLVAHHTPGHAAGHLCFFEERYGSLIAGDMVSTISSILVRPSDGDMTQYMQSLERLARLPSRVVCPAHGPADARGTLLFQEQLAHRRAREVAILAAIEAGARDLEAVVAEVYHDVPASMLGYAALSVESVCRKLAREGRISAAAASRLARSGGRAARSGRGGRPRSSGSRSSD